MTKRWAGWGIWAAALCAGLIYSPLLGASFVWDDAGVQAFQLPSFRTLHDALFTVTGVRGLSWSYYRPLVWLSYMLDRALSGGATSPALAHGVNLALHMAGTALVGLLARRLAGDRPWGGAAALWAALLFAVHPIHAESVASIAGRSDLLAALGVLGAAWLALSWRGSVASGRPWRAAALAGCLFAGLLAKEVALSLLALLPFLFLVNPAAADRGEKPTKGEWALLAAFLLAAVGGYFTLRLWAGTRASDLGAPAGILEFAGRVFQAAGYYVRKALLPWPQRHFVDALPSWGLTALSLGLGALAAAGAAWKSDTEGRRWAALGLGWFAVTLAPSLAVLADPFTAAPVAERYLYLPTVGLCLWAGRGLAALSTARPVGKAIWGAVFLLLAAFAASSAERSLVWRSELSFWESENRHPEAANSSRILGNLANALQQEGRTEEALPLLRRALSVAATPQDRLTAANNLGQVLKTHSVELLGQGRLPEAQALLDETIDTLGGIAFQTSNGPTHAALGSALLLRAKLGAGNDPAAFRAMLERAARHLEIAQRQDPADLGAKVDLAECRMLWSGGR